MVDSQKLFLSTVLWTLLAATIKAEVGVSFDLFALSCQPIQIGLYQLNDTSARQLYNAHLHWYVEGIESLMRGVSKQVQYRIRVASNSLDPLRTTSGASLDVQPLLHH